MAAFAPAIADPVSAITRQDSFARQESATWAAPSMVE
jgi:hypothetical protein